MAMLDEADTIHVTGRQMSIDDASGPATGSLTGTAPTYDVDLVASSAPVVAMLSIAVAPGGDAFRARGLVLFDGNGHAASLGSCPISFEGEAKA
jgi:hypothetical protein